MANTFRIPRHLRFGLLILAAFFFWNPAVAVLDPLPDVIGYLLLWAGLGYVADLHSYLAEARSGFLRMALIDALKLASLLWLMIVPSAKEQPSAQLLLTFVFAVLEMIYAIPAWNHFFDGLFGLLSHDGDLRRYDMVSRDRKGRVRRTRSLPEMLKFSTVGWLIARAVLTTLPEMTALSAHDYTGYVTNHDVDIYEFRRLFVFFAVCIMLVIGLWWLVRMLRLLTKLYRDTELLAALHARYAAEIQPDEGLFLRRRIKLSMLLATLGALLSVDFYIEETNIIPDVLSAVIFAFTVLVLRRYTEKWKPALISCGIWGGASIVAAVFSGRFHSEFYPALIYKNSAAYDAYRWMCVTNILEQLAFAAAMLCFALFLASVIRAVGAEEKRDFRRKLIGWCVFAAFSVLSGIAYDWLLPSVNFIWLIDFTIGIMFAGYTWKEFEDIGDALLLVIQDKYHSYERLDH